LKVAKQAFELDNYYIEIENAGHLRVTILRNGSENFDIAYFLYRLSYMEVVSLDIFELFDEKKFFQIDFATAVDEMDIENIRAIAEKAFKANRYRIRDIDIDEVYIDDNYSENYMKILINTKNQKGLLAYIFAIFEKEGIDVVSAKTQTYKYRVRDIFLVDKKSVYIGAEKLKAMLSKGNT
jgi:[protein-PII] uridylyltransferase